MPILSIITPVFNGADFIQRCYFNLATQTFTDWEWIVVDDGSTDGTVSEINKISDSRVHLVSYPANKGRGYARSQAIKACTGDWMVIWDVDDIHFPERLERINEARLSGSEFFCSYAVVCTNELEIKGVRGFHSPSHGLPKTFVHPTMACRLDIARSIGYDATVRTGEDAEILWMLPANYTGMWYKSALTIYQEDREVNLQKAIDCNKGHLRLLNKLYIKKCMKLTFINYSYLVCKYQAKLIFMYLLKFKPDLYLKSVDGRSYGEVEPNYCLSDHQRLYIESIKSKFNQERL